MGEDGKIKCDLPDVQEWISPEDKASMNMWGCISRIFRVLCRRLQDFLSEVEEGDSEERIFITKHQINY